MTATSPVRIRQDLLSDAAARGKRLHRSAKAQVEYWLMLGKQVDALVDPDTLLDVESGAATLRVEPAQDVTINSAGLLSELTADRESGDLAEMIADRSPLRYRASQTNPGYLDQVDDINETVTVGSFQDGTFTPMTDDR